MREEHSAKVGVTLDCLERHVETELIDKRRCILSASCHSRASGSANHSNASRDCARAYHTRSKPQSFTDSIMN